MVSVQSVLNPAHLLVSVITHPVLLLVKEGSLTPPGGRPAGDTETWCAPSWVTSVMLFPLTATETHCAGSITAAVGLTSPAGFPAGTVAASRQCAPRSVVW